MTPQSSSLSPPHSLVADFEVREGDEDGDLDAEGFGEEEVGYDDEGSGQQNQALQLRFLSSSGDTVSTS
ncbi:hypothetical protein L3X38_015068 [Prunus dulcis]|uniref:Uncharacterized protein n=1 Tax=Prunus dulcis TaxID=3755 RepID=A0AAD4WPK3_PRUDU|nr:hypothetical protein L3X38_015068 [Prunus dulcis]